MNDQLILILLSPHRNHTILKLMMRLPDLRVHALPPMHRLLIVLVLAIRVRHRNIHNLLAHLTPHVARRGDRTDLAQPPVHSARHQEPREEVQIVDALRTDRHIDANRACETDNVDHNTRDVGRIAAPVEAESVVVGACFLTAVQILDLQVPLADDVVVADHDACDGRQEHRVRGEIGGEGVCGGEQVPGTHDEADESTDVGAAADGDPAREESGHVGACGDGVGGDVGTELGEGEGCGDHEDAEALRVPAFFEEALEQVQRVPDWFAAEDDGGGRGHDDADEGGDGEADGDGEELGEEGVRGFAGETGEVRVVDDEGGEVGDCAHDAESVC